MPKFRVTSVMGLSPIIYIYDADDRQLEVDMSLREEIGYLVGLTKQGEEVLLSPALTDLAEREWNRIVDEHSDYSEHAWYERA